MRPHDPTSEPAGISRREAMRRAALLAGVAVSPAWWTAVDRVRPLAQTAHLPAAQAATVRAMADRLLPRTDTPGASDVGVPAFIDLLYGEFMTDTERTLLTDGLEAVDAAGRAASGAAFSTLPAAQQDRVLRTLAQAEEGQPGGFFRLFRSATILGYFTSEEVGRNVLHYDPIPGRYDACVPIAEVGNRNWTT